MATADIDVKAITTSTRTLLCHGSPAATSAPSAITSSAAARILPEVVSARSPACAKANSSGMATATLPAA